MDSHLRRSQLKYITDWVKSGGILYLGAGALRFDEYNKALKFPVKREAYRQLGKAGSAQYFLPKLKVAEVFREMPVIAGMQKPFYRETALGKGKIIYCGFFPGLSYQYSAKKTPDTPYSIWDYPEAHRNFIKALPLGITPRIKTDNYRVEAGLLEAVNLPPSPLLLTEKNGNSPSGQAVFFNELSVTREDNNIYSSALRFFAAIHNITAQVITHNAPPVRVDNTTVLPAVLQPPEAKISRFYQQSARACLSASAELNWMAFQLRFFAAAMSSARSST